MTYSSIDKEIDEWAKQNGLFVQTSYKDCEVRSVEIPWKGKRGFQIWIDPPAAGHVEVHVWNFKKRRKDWRVPEEYLKPALESSLRQVSEWKAQS